MKSDGFSRSKPVTSPEKNPRNWRRSGRPCAMPATTWCASVGAMGQDQLEVFPKLSTMNHSFFGGTSWYFNFWKVEWYHRDIVIPTSSERLLFIALSGISCNLLIERKFLLSSIFWVFMVFHVFSLLSHPLAPEIPKLPASTTVPSTGAPFWVAICLWVSISSSSLGRYCPCGMMGWFSWRTGFGNGLLELYHHKRTCYHDKKSWGNSPA